MNDSISQFRSGFLEPDCQSQYGQGLEDALKARPPKYPNSPEYMQGYNSLVPPLAAQWAA